jgi:hypothetical protein
MQLRAKEGDMQTKTIKAVSAILKALLDKLRQPTGLGAARLGHFLEWQRPATGSCIGGSV